MVTFAGSNSDADPGLELSNVGVPNQLAQQERGATFDRRNSSNLKGASAFMPVGMAPREDELALSESLARGEKLQEPSDGNQNYGQNLDRAGGVGNLDKFMHEFMQPPKATNMDFGPNKNAQALDSKYSNFNFPSIPEDMALQQELM